ncbi:hypothetical protein [Fuerstiella marisgermanici]|uniref:Uncharacterized protein n=1 Tax=Fuerstiella marisgermanici TaxID=1891926 RepID=A0A1P8WB78_9PLAN|nr:hypothetical protein [Fuerstiella marisgermanici]APZ91305.1 hypothetical protein Fuma_00893 [Fuerstiella marisgermanici]
MSLLYPRKIDCPESPTGFKIAPADQRLLDQQAYQIEASQRRAEQREAEAFAEARERRWQQEEEQRRREGAARRKTIAADNSPPRDRVPYHIISMLQERAAKVKTFREQLQQVPRQLVEGGILACFSQHSGVQTALNHGGSRRAVLREAIAKLRVDDESDFAIHASCDYIERLLTEDEVAEQLLQSKPRNVAASFNEPVAEVATPARPVVDFQFARDRLQYAALAAYNGGKIDQPHLPYPIAIDVNTASVEHESQPTLLDHSPAKRVGTHTAQIDKKSGMLHAIQGRFTIDSPAAREVYSSFVPGNEISSHKWQASVRGDWSRLSFIKPGKVKVVNNQRIVGPCLVAHDFAWRETSFTGLGANSDRKNKVAQFHISERDEA